MGRPATCDCGACKKCKQRARMKAWHDAHPGYFALRARERKSRDPEGERTRQREQYRQNAEAKKQKIAQQRLLHPERHRARVLLRRAVKKGWIVRPGICERCQKECRPQAHHRNYALAYAVDWLCSACHGLQHRMF